MGLPSSVSFKMLSNTALSVNGILVGYFVSHFRLLHLQHYFNPVHFLPKQSGSLLPLHRCYATVHNSRPPCVASRKETIQLQRILRNFVTKPFSLQKSQNGDSNETITAYFIMKDKKQIRVTGEVGEDILTVARKNSIKIEGVCDGACICSTCHVYVQDEYLEKLEPMQHDEQDVLDTAVFVEPNSRLGCQVVLTKELDGVELTLPPAVRSCIVDNCVPTPD